MAGEATATWWWGNEKGARGYASVVFGNPTAPKYRAASVLRTGVPWPTLAALADIFASDPQGEGQPSVRTRKESAKPIRALADSRLW